MKVCISLTVLESIKTERQAQQTAWRLGPGVLLIDPKPFTTVSGNSRHLESHFTENQTERNSRPCELPFLCARVATLTLSLSILPGDLAASTHPERRRTQLRDPYA